MCYPSLNVFFQIFWNFFPVFFDLLKRSFMSTPWEKAWGAAAVLIHSMPPMNTAAVSGAIRRVSKRNLLKTTLEKSISKMSFHGFQQSFHHTWAIPMCVDTTGEGSHLGQGPCGVVTLLLNFRFNTWWSVACWFEHGLAVTLWPVHCCLCSLFPNVNEILLPRFILVMKMMNALQCFVCSIRDQRDLLLCLSALRRHGFKIGSCF